MTRAALIAGLILWLLAGVASADAFVLIVHPDNPVTSVDRDFLRNAYLRKTTDWADGRSIRPNDLSPKFPARDRFTREVVKKTPAQLRSYWVQRIFSGKGVPPQELDSVASMIAHVLSDPGAVGYLPASADPGRAKVIRID